MKRPFSYIGRHSQAPQQPNDQLVEARLDFRERMKNIAFGRKAMTEAEAALFIRADDRVRETYVAIMAAVECFGSVVIEPKKTSIHIVAGSAFAGIHPQKSKLRINVRADHPIESARVRKVEQVSVRRFHNEIDLMSPDDVDGELVAWLKDAYALGAGVGA
ncbi:DUF5655 domain-containing protein [Phenylobacterium sp.]|uniref:DUF5655 domain-containing protein n=1 Tax=Phenylobacterium sp. TaxID=1871053 RepID=UPI002E348ADB|nr:DUF5655 domain-containing protein [Phenylobacterium sp.]